MPCGRRSCRSCGLVKSIENALVVALDARENGPPEFGLTLTTLDPFMSSESFRQAVAAVFKRLRRHYGPGVAYLGNIEFTTGRGIRSGGHRRIHAHLLVKGLPGDAVGAVAELVSATWWATTGARRIQLEELRTPAAAIAYYVHHHRKEDQRPPEGWSGMTFRPSRNYFSAPMPVMREAVREEIRMRRSKRAAMEELKGLIESGCPDDVIADLVIARASELRSVKAVPVKLREGRLVDLRTGEVVHEPAERRAA